MFNFLKIKSREHHLLSTKNKKVYLGMSGGVDSSVVAYILKSQGYDVIGIFIKTWQPDYIECTWREDRLDAMRVAAQLDIPLLTLDLEKEYKEGVIDYMISEYERGNTPNPDIMCNREVKFGAFYRYVKSIDPDAMIATGHYANILNGNPSLGKVPKAEGVNLNLTLAKAKDKTKDQVYFLSQIDRNILSDIILPLGNMLKSEVRQIAADNNLYVANKKDSQGICMLGDISIKDFLRKEIPQANELMFYTIGERFNFNINSSDKINTRDISNIKTLIINESKNNIEQGPFYIIKKDVKESIIYISNNKIDNNKNKIYNIKSWNYTSNIELKDGDIYEGQTRYHGEMYRFKVIEHNKITFKLETLDENTLMVSGQTIVLYQGDIMIGGGVINFLI